MVTRDAIRLLTFERDGRTVSWQSENKAFDREKEKFFSFLSYFSLLI